MHEHARVDPELDGHVGPDGVVLEALKVIRVADGLDVCFAAPRYTPRPSSHPSSRHTR